MACPHHDKQQSDEGKTKAKKAMKTGNTLSLPVIFYKESICLVSLCPLANYKNAVTNKKRGFLALPTKARILLCLDSL